MADETRLLVCDCSGSMKLDLESLGVAAKATSIKACSELCGAQSEIAADALRSKDKTLIACTQEAMFFGDLAEELDAGERLYTFDIRDRAGWTSDGAAFAKQAALTADALLKHPGTPIKDVESHGVCLIIGPSELVIDAAKRLSDALAVTCLITDKPDYIRPHSSYDLALGTLSAAEGTFGNFSVVVEGYAPIKRTGRGESTFEAPRNGAKSTCDILLDLTGGTPLFPAPEKRNGYLRPDTGDLLAVERAIFDASQLTGTFEKPLHIRFSPDICAYSRAEQTGCNRCLSVCPTGAITPNGETVLIDDDICAGCGACAAVCPSGAASFDDPPVEHLFLRLRTMASAYRQAGGTAPRILFHDAEFGGELIKMSSRFGRGLPADVIPIDVYNVEGVGHAELMAALSVGFAEALVLMSPKSDLTAPEGQIELAQALLEGVGHKAELVRLLHATDPETLEDILHDAPVEPLTHDPILPLGGRRDV
ncbi:MAG: 4Fe-4S dicluster domain-containing protein, partial [Rhizobiales bacterium]|nr:4Fe-4S dicluster domain-containing protein [Hyphomicrobiales bacterium]